MIRLLTWKTKVINGLKPTLRTMPGFIYVHAMGNGRVGALEPESDNVPVKDLVLFV